MKKSDSIKELSQAMSLFLGDIENVTKDKAGYSYKYADLAQLLGLVRPSLNRYGLAVMQSIELGENRGGVEYYKVCTLLTHLSGEWIESELEMPAVSNKNMNAAQAVGSVGTYARRYALAALLGIAQEDDDGKQGTYKRNVSNPVSEEQAEQLKELVISAGLAPETVAKGMGVNRLVDVPAHKFDALVKRLKERAAAEKGE